MSAPIIPISKLGTAFQSPSWRWQITFCPERFGFEKYCSRPASNAANLTRLIANGLTPVETFKLPLYLSQLRDELPSLLYAQLMKVWNKHWRRTRSRKATFNVNVNRTGLLNWNVARIGKINDPFLQKLIKHCYNIEGDEHISDAIKFFKNKQNDLTCKWMNYSIYGGKTDKELAIQWHKPIRFIEALRLIFFDYSGWPKDKLVQYSLLRQLTANGEIDSADYHIFRRIYDLGDLGLRSILGHQMLSEDERDTIKLYLSGAGVDNLMDQRFSITNLKESVIFNRSTAEFANIGLRKLQLEQQAAIMRLTAERMKKEMGIEENNKIYIEDTVLMDNLVELMQIDKSSTFPTYIDIQTEEVK